MSDERVKQELGEIAEEFTARVLVSDDVRALNLDLEVLRVVGPLMFLEGAAHVLKTYDCYPKKP